MPVRVIVVRHGERLDEADSQEWRRVRTQETLHDPPLTAAGWDQSKLAARKIAAVLDQETHVSICSSPTARTLSTAAGIVAGLPGVQQQVTPVYSLNCCAAAQRHGVAKAFPKGKPPAEVLKGIPLTCWPAMGSSQDVDHRQGGGEGFVEATKELATLCGDGQVLVLVTHREGIWQLLRHVGGKMKTSYCNITWLSFDPKTQALSSWDPTPQLGRAPIAEAATRQRELVPAQQPSAVKAVAADEAATVDETGAKTLEVVLAQGAGPVVMYREGRDGAGTLLWRTPGVRGAWADGGAVPNGEIVNLRSSPVSSEGNEGDFVLVRRASGIEGWTKVKNMRVL